MVGAKDTEMEKGLEWHSIIYISVRTTVYQKCILIQKVNLKLFKDQKPVVCLDFVFKFSCLFIFNSKHSAVCLHLIFYIQLFIYFFLDQILGIV